LSFPYRNSSSEGLFSGFSLRFDRPPIARQELLWMGDLVRRPSKAYEEIPSSNVFQMFAVCTQRKSCRSVCVTCSEPIFYKPLSLPSHLKDPFPSVRWIGFGFLLKRSTPSDPFLSWTFDPVPFYPLPRPVVYPARRAPWNKRRAHCTSLVNLFHFPLWIQKRTFSLSLLKTLAGD